MSKWEESFPKILLILFLNGLSRPFDYFTTGSRLSCSVSSQTLPNSSLALNQKLTNISFSEMPDSIKF